MIHRYTNGDAALVEDDRSKEQRRGGRSATVFAVTTLVALFAGTAAVPVQAQAQFRDCAYYASNPILVTTIEEGSGELREADLCARGDRACTLREAIYTANFCGGTKFVRLQPGATYRVTQRKPSRSRSRFN